MDPYEWWEKVLSAIETVGADIVKNWGTFLTIFVLYTIAVVAIVWQYYKHARESIEYDKERIEKQQDEYKALKEEHAKYKAEIDSPEYQAYLMARNISKTNLSDVDMFSKKKKK